MQQKSNRVKDLVIVATMVAVIAGVSHFVVTNPLGPSRVLYFFQAPIIQWTVQCSRNAPDWMPKIQRYATLNMGAPAGQLAYVSKSGRLSHCEVGWNDGIFGDQRLEPDDRFRYASTTKTVTAIAVLDLINQGKLNLQDRIVEVLEIQGGLRDPRVQEITVEHLLSHRAGWDRLLTQDAMFAMNSEPWCPSKPERLKNTVLIHDPGETESYSNLGYCLLGLAIEKVSGRPFREYLVGHFNFEATSLAFVDGPYLPDEVQYDTRNEEFYTADYHKYFDFQALSSSAGLSGNASDLALLVSGSLEGGEITILDGAANGSCEPGEVNECYGYGVYRYQSRAASRPLFIHGGKLPGATSSIIVEPDGGVLVWLGAGSPSQSAGVLKRFYDYIDEVLTERDSQKDSFAT